jgi:general stress protein 26
MTQRQEEVGRLLDGAAEAVSKVRYCWLMTAGERGHAAPRPMGRLPVDAGEDPWTVRFVTNRRSRKASDIRRDGKVTVLFQHEPDEAYVTLIGTARLKEDASEVDRRWKHGYEVYFPERGRADAAFVEIDVERMELWIRGVTPEPYGLVATKLERTAERGWRLAA